MDSPKTLLEAIKFFSDEQVCIDAVASMRWMNGAVCPDCETANPYYIKTQKRWKCRECRRQFSVKVGTIFEDSPISLTKWLPALWLLTNCKNGISSYEIARDLAVTQKTAWFMLQRLRLVLKSGFSAKLGEPGGGPVEADETFIGGKVKNMHKNRRPKGPGASGKPVAGTAKTIVVGMLERRGRVSAHVVEDRTHAVLHKLVEENVHPDATLMTDEWGGYKGTDLMHEVINHAESYVRGHIHTNGIENFWSLLKRGLNGTYVSVEPFHLSRYLDEQMFRYNNRATKDNPLTDADRFALALSQVANKRLTYAELTGKLERAEA
jgi:transposase-like protein